MAKWVVRNWGKIFIVIVGLFIWGSLIGWVYLHPHPANATATLTTTSNALKIEKPGVLYLAEYKDSRCYVMRIINGNIGESDADSVNVGAVSDIAMQCHQSAGSTGSKITALATIPSEEVVEVQQPFYGDICEVAWTSSINNNLLGTSKIVLDCRFAN